MKSKLIGISGAAALAFCAFTTTSAQASPLPNVSVNVPFDFVVSGKTLPAGEYQVVGAASRASTAAFAVRNVRTKNAAIAVMPQRSAAPSGESQVVFSCFDSKCYLRELKVSGVESYIASTPRAPGQKERTISLGLRFTSHAD